jgi:hypothetical protein
MTGIWTDLEASDLMKFLRLILLPIVSSVLLAMICRKILGILRVLVSKWTRLNEEFCVGFDEFMIYKLEIWV